MQPTASDHALIKAFLEENEGYTLVAGPLYRLNGIELATGEHVIATAFSGDRYFEGVGDTYEEAIASIRKQIQAIGGFRILSLASQRPGHHGRGALLSSLLAPHPRRRFIISQSLGRIQAKIGALCFRSPVISTRTRFSPSCDPLMSTTSFQSPPLLRRAQAVRALMQDERIGDVAGVGDRDDGVGHGDPHEVAPRG